MNRHTLPTGGYQGYTGYGTKDEELARLMQKEAAAAGVGPDVVSAPNYDAMDRNSAYYQEMLARGMDSSPTNFTGGLARLANAFVGRQGLNRLEKREGEAQAYEAAQAQKQSDKLTEMARMMAGPDADAQTLAMAQFDPEGFAKSRFEIDVNAAKPVTQEGPDYFTETRMVNGKPQIVELQRGNPNYERIIGEGEPKRALVQNTVNTGDSPAAQADALLDPPQTKGKDPALVFDADGFARVSPNAQQKGLNAAALKFNDLKAKNDLVSDDINRALGVFTVVDPETGTRSVNPDQRAVGAYSAMKDIPIFGGSTEAGTLESYLTTLQANVGFGELQAMREASPTGGALGQVSEREIAFLQALLGDIEQSRNPEILMYNLERLDTFMAGRQQRFQAAFEADYPTATEYVTRREGARTEVEDLVSLYLDEE